MVGELAPFSSLSSPEASVSEAVPGKHGKALLDGQSSNLSAGLSTPLILTSLCDHSKYQACHL